MDAMKAYLRTCPTDCPLQREQVYIVYKFLNTPIDVLVSGMHQMQPNQLTQFYRKLAKQLHPDKNCHPQAKDAFQRVQCAMD
jgi:DnaJ domain